jgi:RNA polymerase sigma factor (sigma-70 family)
MFVKPGHKNDETDAELVQQYRSGGEPEVLGILYQRYMDLVYGVCLKYLKDSDTAKDAVISIYEELVTKLKQHEVSNFKSWLYVLCRNFCLMHLRRQKGKQTAELTEQVMQSEELLHLESAMQKEEQFQQMEQCLEQLTEDQKNCVRLFYLESKCYNEISDQTGLEWNKVRSHIQNGRRNLKLCMEGMIGKNK